MGQQQLLLIVLGVIIVGIAVVVGINVFTASSANANRDAVISDLTTLAAMAQQYYRKPIAMGGGGNSFDASTGSGGTAWDVPASLDTTANGVYTASSVGANSVTLVGVGNEVGNDGSAGVKVTMVVGKNSISSTTINN
jgi:Tfp pilus assembly protein PilE